jgi:hypothetical protein
MQKAFRTFIILLFILFSGVQSVYASDPDPEAVNALRTMHANLAKAAGLDFVTRFQGSDATLGTSYRGKVHYIVRQPNLLRLTATTSKGSFVIVSDGKVLTIHQPARRLYHQMPAKDSIVGNLYLVAGLIGVEIRMIDFFWTVDYLAGDLGYGLATRSGTKKFGGKVCDGYRVTRDQDRWDIWVDRSAERWPCHLISKRTDGNAALSQTNTFTWQLAPKISESTFEFVPPKGHQAK